MLQPSLQYVHVGQPWVLTKPMPSENNKVCSNDMKITKNLKSVGMTLAKVKEQDGMTLAKVKEQDGMTLAKVRHAQVSHAPH